MEHLVSVIVPVYNVEAYLPKCIDSILAQTYTNLEIVLVNDGSPDHCGQICDDYAAKDHRIRVIHRENGGPGYAKNSGIEIARGTYILFVDSDDYLTADAVQVLYDRIVADGSDIAVGRHTDLYENGRTDDTFCSWMIDAVITGRDVLAQMGENNRLAVVAWAKLYRSELFQEIRYPSLKCSEDLWIFPKLVSQCDRISIVNKTIYYYRQRSTSILHHPTEERILDDIFSAMAFVRFLWNNGYCKSALWWFSVKVDKALLLRNKQAAVTLFENNLNQQELDQLLKGAGWKTGVKWLALRSPIVYSAIKAVKKIVRRG